MAPKCVVMGITGGIAAYKSAETVSRLKKLGVEVRVIMTDHATRFIAPLTLETLSGYPVARDLFDRETPWEVEHIALAKKADVFLIAPATANIIAKMASGIADDMLSTTVLATEAPVLMAPAMNTRMYENAATQENLRKLRQRGVLFVEPEEGRLACGDTGPGRMAEPVDIVERVMGLLQDSDDLQGLRILVTAGPTREPLDPVRYLTNRSSGRMGYAVARRARLRGAQVTLITGPTDLTPPEGVTVVPVTTTLDMYEAVLERYSQCDIAVKAAAPADFRPQEQSPEKIHKNGDGMDLLLTANPDIAAELGRRKKDQVLVIFAAETNDVLESAHGKLKSKNADLMVANDVTQPGAGFGVDTNIVTLIGRDGELQSLPQMSKNDVADRVLDAALDIYRSKRP